MSKILVTGGAGYIGSHTVVALIEKGFVPVILDNFSNSKPVVLERIEAITGVRPELLRGDIRDRECLQEGFNQHRFAAVIHFAGLKAVGESVAEPMRYYQNNVEGTLHLLEVMAEHQCKQIVFSSSAAVYGDPESVPIPESASLRVTNPYGQTKLTIEHILRDLSRADDQWRIAILRYFNPVAAHESGLIGEDPQGIPNNLLPYIAQVAVGKLSALSVFGNDYETPDGTGVRDYIHVCDLADAHLQALEQLDQNQGCAAFNVGTGEGYSVLEMVAAFEKASGKKIPYEILPRRAGDVATTYADPSLSAKKLAWKAKFGLAKMMEDHWRWQSGNPNGYD